MVPLPSQPAASDDAWLRTRLRRTQAPKGMGSHMCHRSGLLGCIGGCSSRWSRSVLSSGARIATSTSHSVADGEITCSEGACLVDRRSHSCVARGGVLEDGENVLGAIRRLRRKDATFNNAQSLRRRGHSSSLGSSWLRTTVTTRLRRGSRHRISNPSQPVASGTPRTFEQATVRSPSDGMSLAGSCGGCRS